MEKMPFQEALEAMLEPALCPPPAVCPDWQRGLPVLTSAHVKLRELRLSDAASLLAMLNTEEVSRFISPPPTTINGFEKFICWANSERQAGRYACFAVVPKGMDTAIGLFQLRQLEPGFATAEWGFAIGSEFWGSGLFVESAKLVLNFAFDEIGVLRLEARACVQNRRGSGALRKMGAVPEAFLRRSFFRYGEYCDQQLWALHADTWRRLSSQSLTVH